MLSSSSRNRALDAGNSTISPTDRIARSFGAPGRDLQEIGGTATLQRRTWGSDRCFLGRGPTYMASLGGLGYSFTGEVSAVSGCLLHSPDLRAGSAESNSLSPELAAGFVVPPQPPNVAYVINAMNVSNRIKKGLLDQRDVVVEEAAQHVTEIALR